MTQQIGPDEQNREAFDQAERWYLATWAVRPEYLFGGTLGDTASYEATAWATVWESNVELPSLSLAVAAKAIIRLLPVTEDAYEWALAVPMVADMLAAVDQQDHTEEVTALLFSKAWDALLAYQPATDDPWDLEEIALAAGQCIWYLGAESKNLALAASLMDFVEQQAKFLFSQTGAFDQEYVAIHRERLAAGLEELRSSPAWRRE